jgi:hypothetical protein
MQSFTRNVVAMTALIAGALAPRMARAQALPAASELVAKYVTAIGGKAEVLKITSMKQLATMDIPSVGLKAEMEMYSAAPNKVAMKTTIPGMGEMQNGYNGEIAWDVNPMQGPRLLADRNWPRLQRTRTSTPACSTRRIATPRWKPSATARSTAKRSTR